ncbi:hypothetical protein OF83DRAFT_352342 [Amylostereum chailletii]|nr:hypothetical protein OF83DRAFT_352342 [Amylostereum chailletii]
MPLSTTSTLSYDLAKFSRETQAQAQAQSQGLHPSSGVLEWQHFVEPVIKLSLDIRKNEQGNLESVKLRVVWDMSAGDMNTIGSDVVLETLDLLSFSEVLPIGGQTTAPEDLPLKAIYRDSTVGIRHLHLPPRNGYTAGPRTYRRLQMTFAESRAASEFVNAIRPVCPCQHMPNGTPRSNTQASTVRSNGEKSIRPTDPLPVASRSARSTAFTASQKCPDTSSQLKGLPTPNVTSFPRVPLQSSSPDLSMASSDPAGLSSSPLGFNSSSRPSSAISETSAVRPGYNRNRTGGNLASVSQQERRHLLPSSSPPSYVSADSQMLPPAVPASQDVHIPTSSQVNPLLTPSQSTTEPENTRSAFMKVLQERHSLYDMSRAELEMLIAEVIREPEFLRLVSGLNARGYS